MIVDFFGRATVIGEKMRSGVSVSTVVKYVIYSVAALFLILLQTTFFTRFRPFGSVPDILILSVMMIGMYDGGRAGAIFGVIIGFAADALGSVGIMMLPLAYMLVGYVCGVVATEYYRRSWLLFLIFDAGTIAVRAFTTLMYVTMTWNSFVLSDVVGNVLLPELAATAVISPLPAIFLLPVYLIFRNKKKDPD